MYFAELLYARTRLLWYTAICLVIGAIYVYFLTFPPRSVHVVEASDLNVPLEAVLLFASLIAMIMASIVSSTLNREQSHLAYVWTKPAPRYRIALGCMLVDVLTIVVAFVVATVVATATLAIPSHNHVLFTSVTGPVVARAVAAPLMVYGIVEVATSWKPARMSGVRGTWWPIAIALLVLAELPMPFPLKQIVAIVNWFNPMAYLPDLNGHGGVISMASLYPLAAFNAQTLVAYCIFIAACVIAIYNWKRMEA